MNSEIRAVVITVSDSRNEETDVSGATLSDALLSIGAEVREKIIVSDDLEAIRQALVDASESEDVNLILTTGGTGFSTRDTTPEATRAVIEKEAPGLAEAMRAETLKNTRFAMLSRGICGIRNQTLIINLPGSPKAVRECFDVIKPVLQHAVNLLAGNIEHKN